ncbi:TIGR04024 family LLM class F420-dependent oxidoreductase [Salinarchaeum chitinilyticum]
MTDIDVHLPVTDLAVDDVADLAVRAERLGYDQVWQPETWGRDAVTAMTAIVERTESIGVGSSVLNVYSRSPALLGQTAATLQEHSDDRFRLGIGPSGPILIEAWHGVEFDRPLRRTRETVEIVRQVCSGETLDYDGDLFDLSTFRLRSAPPETPPPVDVAAMGPKAVEMVGRFADGWHGIVMSPDAIDDRLDDLERGAELGNRDVDDVRTTISVTCCVDEDAERARELVSEHLAFYVGGMGTYYRDALARQGHEEVAMEIAAEWANGNRDRATELVSEELLSEMTAAGTRADARASLDRFAEVAGVDAIALGFPRGASLDQVRNTMHALAPE